VAEFEYLSTPQSCHRHDHTLAGSHTPLGKFFSQFSELVAIYHDWPFSLWDTRQLLFRMDRPLGNYLYNLLRKTTYTVFIPHRSDFFWTAGSILYATSAASFRTLSAVAYW
jgi:hypothetical protein